MDCENLTDIKGIENLNTENVTDMFDTFAFCKSLTKLDVSHFDTSKVTNMGFMFFKCGLLTKLDVSGFDTSNVTLMYGMFADCSQLVSLDVSGFDTSNVTDMSFMFDGCKFLTSLDVTSFNTSKVKSTNYMFAQCENLSALDLSSFDTSSIKYTTEIDFEDEYPYYGISEMFENCTNLKTIYVSDSWKLNEDVIINSSDVFKNCDKLVGGAGTKYVAPSEPKSLIEIGPAPTTDAKYARVDCPESSAPGYLTFVAKVDFAGGDGATGEAPASVKGIQGEDIVLPSGSSFSRSGYKFIGWSDGTKTYEAGAKYKVGTSNI